MGTNVSTLRPLRRRTAPEPVSVLEAIVGMSSANSIVELNRLTREGVQKTLGKSKTSVHVLYADPLVNRVHRVATTGKVEPDHFAFGSGLTGAVAKNGKSIVVADVSKDTRYKEKNDRPPEFEYTNALYGTAIFPVLHDKEHFAVTHIQAEDGANMVVEKDKKLQKVISMLQFCRRVSDGPFSKDELTQMAQITAQYGNCLQFLKERAEFNDEMERKDRLLEMSQAVYEELDTTALIVKILNHAKKLIGAQMCSLFLIDKEKKELYAHIFDAQVANDSHILGSQSHVGRRASLTPAATPRQEPSKKASSTGQTTLTAQPLAQPRPAPPPTSVKANSDGKIVPPAQLPPIETKGAKGSQPSNNAQATALASDSGISPLPASAPPPSKKKQNIRFPIGVGIAGHVAATGETLNIPDAYKEPRFNQDVDKKTGFRTKTILCSPIYSHHEIIAVAQLINKTNGEFTPKDEMTFKSFLVFAGNAIRNAQLYEEAVFSTEQRRVLLKLAESIFEEFDLTIMMKKIMAHAIELVPCDRCSVFLADHDKGELYSRIFDFKEEGGAAAPPPAPTDKPKAPPEIRFPMNKGIAGHVATTRTPLNIPDAYADPRFNRTVDDQTGFKTRNILCMPILKGGTCVGVAQLVNKADDASFDDADEQVLQAFAIFCGIAINNAQLYEQSLKAQARTKVALELISYHTKVDEAIVKRLAATKVPSAHELGIDTFDFSPRPLTEEQRCLVVLRMMLDLDFIEKYRINYMTLCRFILTIANNYRQVPYHNWIHAISVTHSLYTLIKTCQLDKYFPNIELFALLVACLCHDVDHRGKNNAFQKLDKNALASLYEGTSVMEMHHFDHSIMILHSDGLDILSGLHEFEQKTVLDHIKRSIIATDLANHFTNIKEFAAFAENPASFDPTNPKHRYCLNGMIMTSSDISDIARPWPIQNETALNVYQEFFEQGDAEIALGQTPIPMMDRNKADIPKCQLGFIDFVCQPVYAKLAQLLPASSYMLEGVKSNRENWQAAYDLKLKNDEIAGIPPPKSDGRVFLPTL